MDTRISQSNQPRPVRLHLYFRYCPTPCFRAWFKDVSVRKRYHRQCTGLSKLTYVVFGERHIWYYVPAELFYMTYYAAKWLLKHGYTFVYAYGYTCWKRLFEEDDFSELPPELLAQVKMEEFKEMLKADPRTFAAWVSIQRALLT